MNYETRTLNDAELDAVTGGGAIVAAIQFAEVVGEAVGKACGPNPGFSAQMVPQGMSCGK
jgi:hypothetical protein